MKTCQAIKIGEGLNWDVFGGDPDPDMLQKFKDRYFVSNNRA